MVAADTLLGEHGLPLPHAVDVEGAPSRYVGHLHTLGRLTLEPGGFSRPKPLVVLAYLAVEGPTRRSRLCELFFASSADPSDSLSTTLRRLGKVPGCVETVGDEVIARVTCDASQVLAMLDAGDHEGACRSYSGGFLAGLAVDLPVEGEEWVFAVREYLARRVIEAHLTLGERGLSAGDAASALRHATAAYQLARNEELEPGVLARLYHLMQRSGRSQADAVLSAARRGDAGIDVRSGHGAVLEARLGPLPGSQLISREAELDAVVQALTTGESRLVTVHGPGGIGKTRLAQEAIRSAALELAFGPERYFVALEGVASADLVPSAVAKVVALGAAAGAGTWTGLAGAIGDRRLLLVLDAWEHLMPAAPHLVSLLEACPGLHLLVTSRERLGAPVEWSLTLRGLALPAVDAGPAARGADAMRMFVQQARKHDLGFELADADVPAAARICRAVDGLPLGLAMAAAWTRGVPLGELAEALERDVTSLSHAAATSERHASLGRVVEASWAALTERQRDVLRRLSVCRGFRREAAAATAAHRRHYRELLEARLASGADSSPEVLAALGEEEGNLAHCLDSAVAQGDGEALALMVGPLRWFYAVQGRFRDGDALFAHVLAQVDESDPRFTLASSALYAGRAWFSRYAGELADALKLGRRAVELARGLPGPVLRDAHQVLGEVHMLAGENPRALEQLGEALRLATEAGDHTARLRVMESIVHVRTAMGDHAGAAAVVDDALATVEAGLVPPSVEVVAVYVAVGLSRLAALAWPAAREGFERGLELAEEIGALGPEMILEAGACLAMVGEGIEARDDGLVASAAERSSAALPVAERRAETLSQAFLCAALARAAMYGGDLAAAEARLRQAYRAGWARGNRAAGTWIAPWLVELLRRQGRDEEAGALADAVCREPATPAWARRMLGAAGAAVNGEPADGLPASASPGGGPSASAAGERARGGATMDELVSRFLAADGRRTP